MEIKSSKRSYAEVERQDNLLQEEINELEGTAEATYDSPELNLEPTKSKKKSKESGGGIKTFCRIRPIKEKNEIFKIAENSEGRNLSVHADAAVINKLNSLTTFTFSRTFDEKASQQEVFELTCKSLTEDLLVKRKSGLIFTYGMTNAGKTYTVIGSPSDPGILPMSLKYLYKRLENEENLGLNVFCSFVEIYNEDVFDLLAFEAKNKFFKKKMAIKENMKKQFFLPDITYHKIASLEDFSQALNLGISKKVHAATSLNQHSSRSHTIFKIVLKVLPTDEDELSLSIVDLAGSERSKRTEAAGKEIIEACSINQSLSVLGKCMEALRHNSLYTNKKIVPFRESKLTKLFQEYFQGDQNVLMITNINPRKEDFEETMRALNYSCIAKDIKPIKSKVIVNPMKKQVKILDNPESTGPNTINLNNSINNIALNNNNIPSSNGGDINGLKQELERLREELYYLKNKPEMENEEMAEERTSVSKFNSYNRPNFSNNNIQSPAMYNQELQFAMMNQMMQMMKRMERIEKMANPSENPMTMFFPSNSPFPFLNQNNAPIQLENSDGGEGVVSDVNMDLIPNKTNSFNLVFINSKFNDFHMGNKKRRPANPRNKKKNANEEVPVNIDLNDVSIQSDSEFKSDIEIREVDPPKNDLTEEIKEETQDRHEEVKTEKKKKNKRKVPKETKESETENNISSKSKNEPIEEEKEQLADETKEEPPKKKKKKKVQKEEPTSISEVVEEVKEDHPEESKDEPPKEKKKKKKKKVKSEGEMKESGENIPKETSLENEEKSHIDVNEIIQAPENEVNLEVAVSTNSELFLTTLKNQSQITENFVIESSHDNENDKTENQNCQQVESALDSKSDEQSLQVVDN